MRLDEEKFLERFVLDYKKIFPEGAQFKDIISALEENKIILEIDGPNISIEITDECTDEINRTLSDLIKITEKPHSFIKAYEEKVYVSTAKRINSKAISYLSRNSNDWFARTILSVVPKYILSDINEETYDLYENRFIVTLIDRIFAIIIDRKIKYENLLERIKNDKAQQTLINKGYISFQANSNELSKKLLRNRKNTGDNNTSYERVYTFLEKLYKIQNKLRQIKQSKLYTALQKCRREHNPIQKTNILLFDLRYNAAYRLWEYLDTIDQNETPSADDSIRNYLPVWYNLFVLITVAAALKDMNFTISVDSTIKLDDENICLNNKLEFKKGSDLLQLFYSNKRIEIQYYIDSDKKCQDKISIIPDFKNFEGKNKYESTVLTDEILQTISMNKEYDAQFSFISADIRKCSEHYDWGEKLYRRIFNIGDNYSNEETQIEKLSFYKSGILIISPMDFQTNFIRIQRLIHSRILRTKVKNIKSVKNIDECPLCESEKIKHLNDNDIICTSCNHFISIAYCSACKTQFLWIKYKDDDFLNNPDVVKDLKIMAYYDKIMRYEAIMREYAVTSFFIEQDKSGDWKLKSLCPKCGLKLGDSKNKSI